MGAENQTVEQPMLSTTEPSLSPSIRNVASSASTGKKPLELKAPRVIALPPLSFMRQPQASHPTPDPPQFGREGMDPAISVTSNSVEFRKLALNREQQTLGKSGF